MKTQMDYRLYQQRVLRDNWRRPSFWFKSFIGCIELMFILAFGALITIAAMLIIS